MEQQSPNNTVLNQMNGYSSSSITIQDTVHPKLVNADLLQTSNQGGSQYTKTKLSPSQQPRSIQQVWWKYLTFVGYNLNCLVTVLKALRKINDFCLHWNVHTKNVSQKLPIILELSTCYPTNSCWKQNLHSNLNLTHFLRKGRNFSINEARNISSEAK